MDLKLIEKNIFEFNSEQEYKKNHFLFEGTIIKFPFKKLSYKSIDFFWYLPNYKLNDINISDLINVLKKRESIFGTTYVEGEKVKIDGPYNLGFINLDQINYKINIIEQSLKLDIIYLELFK
jgi:hypothetical protein